MGGIFPTVPPTEKRGFLMERSHHGEKLYMQVFREIRQYMVDNNLQPGDLLPTEQQLCQKLGVSRNVLREAIKSMEVMGLIEACPGRGTEVREFNLEFILQNVLCFSSDDMAQRRDELAGLQKTLELSYMRPAFQNISREDVAKLRACVNDLNVAEQGEEALQAHHAIHQVLFRALDNRVLRDLLNAVDGLQRTWQKEGCQTPELPEKERAEAIVRALEEYNFQAFAQAMVAYFSRGIFARKDNSYYED